MGGDAGGTADGDAAVHQTKPVAWFAGPAISTHAVHVWNAPREDLQARAFTCMAECESLVGHLPLLVQA
jgi:hypothetical protein